MRATFRWSICSSMMTTWRRSARSIPSISSPPGDMRQFTVDVKMTRDVQVPAARLYRAANASQSTVLVLEAMDLVIYQPKLTVTLKSDVSAIQAGASVTLVCNVVNERAMSPSPTPRFPILRWVTSHRGHPHLRSARRIAGD